MLNSKSTSRSDVSTADSSIALVQETIVRNVAVTWALGLIIGLFIVNQIRSYVVEMQGPEFLFFYAAMFVTIWIVLIALRRLWEDSLHVTLLALLTFEGIGTFRYIDASAAGMHKFTVMFLMMVIGGTLLFTRADNSHHSKSSSNCSGGSSGCGSSCGGGGGCGGCG